MNLLNKAIKSKFDLMLIGSYIKRSISTRVVKFLHHSGFYIEKITDANSLHSKLTKGGVHIKEDELRKTTNHLRRINDIKLYDQILRKFVSQMDMNFSNAEFTGSGCGATTLNVYRKVICGDEVLFEKVYFNSSLDIVRVKWFYDNIYSSLTSNINVPALYKVFGGELITLFYFKFEKLVPLSVKDVDATIFNLSKELYKMSLTTDIKRKIDNAPPFLKDYKGHFEYKRKSRKAEKKIVQLLGNSFPLKNIEQAISESPLILTHADIHPGNVFQNNFLIDCDPFGLYPVGLEVAYIFLFLYQGKLSCNELIEILESEYRSTIVAEHWDDFEMNFLYFYFVFTIQPSVKTELNDIQCDILKRIEELYSNKLKRE